MEFDEHEEEEEEQEEEIEMHQTAEGKGNEGILSAAAVTLAATREGGGDGGGGVRCRYKECLKNHAVQIGGHAVDGCGEFMAAGEEGTLDALMCAACNCHRNFHRKVFDQPSHHHHSHQLLHRTLTFHHHDHQFSNLHATSSSHPARPDLALPSSTSREDEDMSNPSSSGGGGSGGGGGGSGGGSGSKKRFRTKFTQEQKDKMFTFAEKLGWRIQRQDEADVQQFCAEHNIRRHVFKVWMHNNKHTLGKKP